MGIVVSVIIVNYNTRELLRECLKPFFVTPAELETEVFVVDNGSGDGSADMVRRTFPHARLIENRDNLGFARAGNQALAQARGEYILFLNSDAVILGDALVKMLRFIDRHREIGAVGPKMRYPDARLQFSCHNIPCLKSAFFEMSGLAKLFSKDEGDILRKFDYDVIRQVGYVSGACLLTRRSILNKIGAFDERFFMYAEEADLCMRIWKAGYKVFFFPEAEVSHHLRGSLGTTLLQKTSREKLKSNYLLFHKHCGVASAKSFVFLYLLSILPRLLISIFMRRNFSLYASEFSTALKLFFWGRKE